MNGKLIICNKCFQFYKCLNSDISKNLTNTAVEARPVKNHGLCSFILIPAILILNNTIYDVTTQYTLISFVSIGLLIYSILFIIFISLSSMALRENFYGGCAASSLISALLIYFVLGQDLIYALFFTTPAVGTFSLVLRMSLTWFPKTFTVGEAIIVSQGVVMFVLMSLMKALYKNPSDLELDLTNVVNYTVLSTVGIIVVALYLLSDENRNLNFLTRIILVAAVYAFIVLNAWLGWSSIFMVLDFIFIETQRIQLFIFWLFLVIVAAVVIIVRTMYELKADTVTRKTFHILASLVFMSGILFDLELMRMAAGVAFGLLIFVEALRKSGIEPISSALQSAFILYSDEKDSGMLALTPIYLFTGLSCPLVLVPIYSERRLELLSGVLAVGIGDTAASYFGSRYGNYKWCGNNKTVEGSFFNVMAQLLTVYLLEASGLLMDNNVLIRTLIAASLSALVEATTDQIDNLILPLVTILGFQITSFLS